MLGPKTSSVALLAAASLIGLAGCSPSGDQTANSGNDANAPGATTSGTTAEMKTASGEALQIKGSDTLNQLTQAWAEAFQKAHPDIQVSVTGGGSSVGITALINGQANIANASRAMEAKETTAAEAKGIHPVEHVVARDALSIIVNKSNPVNELTLDQVAGIYLGTTTSWKALGGPDEKIVAAARDTSSGTYVYFKEHVLKKKEYATTTLHLPSNTAIAKMVGQDAGGIGYVGIGYVSPDVKAIKIKKDAASPSVAPTVANVLNNTYSLSRPLYEYSNGEPTGNAKTWFDFVQGPEGQKIVAAKEFIPVGKP